MTWFKVDDSFYDHPKVFDAPDCAVALWVRAGSWSARNLTDGFVPTKMPARLCDDPDNAVRELIRRGLWSRVSGGYRFHDWDRYQPTRRDVERDREAATERKRKQRQRQKQQVKPGGVTDMSRRDTRVSHTGSHGTGHTSPTRPDPTTSGTGTYAPQGRTEPAPEPPPDQAPTRVEQLIAGYRDVSPRGIPAKLAEQLSAEIHRLVQGGSTDAEIMAGLAELRPRKLGPGCLASLVDEMANRAPGAPTGHRRSGDPDIQDVEINGKVVRLSARSRQALADQARYQAMEAAVGNALDTQPADPRMAALLALNATARPAGGEA